MLQAWENPVFDISIGLCVVTAGDCGNSSVPDRLDSLLPIKDCGAFFRQAYSSPQWSEELTTHAVMTARQVYLRMLPALQFSLAHQQFQRPSLCIQFNYVAILNQTNRSVIQGFWRQMYCGGDLTRRTGHPAIGNQCNFISTILQYTQCWRQFMQLGHSTGFGTLEAHHGNKIFVQVAALKSSLHILLGMEDHSRCFHFAIIGLYR